MLKKIKSYSSVLWQLILADLVGYSSSRYLKDLLDSFFWIATTLFVSGKLLGSFGIAPGFGIFVATGVPATRCLFQIYGRTTTVIIDFLSNKSISYDITLPIPSWLAIFRIALSSCIRNLLLSLPALPFGLIFVWDEFNPATVCILKYILILFLTAFCCATLGLLIASVTNSAEELGSIWNRILSPMWMLGGFQFPWSTLNAKISFLGKLALLNPMTYAMEGIRSTILGPEKFLSFWLCVVALIVFSTLFSYFGIKRMAKKLDSV
ncbi:hypothetical protein FJ366_03285 [Candidatus Dependentiae bacterium]|nr:hypothetical protein [Candidatus Dependentiae bacterium]